MFKFYNCRLFEIGPLLNTIDSPSMIYASFYFKIATLLFFDIVSILLMNVFDDAIILQVSDSLPFVAIIEKKTMYLVTLILKSNQSISTAKEVTKMIFCLA